MENPVNNEGIKKVVERVKKLFSLAGNNPSKEQAHAALLKAQELLGKYNLSMKDLKETTREALERCVDIGRGKLFGWEISLGSLIAENFRCVFFLRNKYRDPNSVRRATIPGFIGLEGDIDVAEYTYQQARTYALGCWEQYHKKAKLELGVSKMPRMGEHRNDFLLGFLSGLESLFRQQVRTSESCALMIVKPTEVVEAAKKLKRGRKRNLGRDANGHSSALLAGMLSGKRFNPNGALNPSAGVKLI